MKTPLIIPWLPQSSEWTSHTFTFTYINRGQEFTLSMLSKMDFWKHTIKGWHKYEITITTDENVDSAFILNVKKNVSDFLEEQNLILNEFSYIP